MRCTRLLDDDDAVSPVIAVILMVAITVILAAVIASFVLGLGDQASQTAPQASFSFDFNDSPGTGDTDGVLNVTHDGGDTIHDHELFVRGDGFATGIGPADIGSAGTWAGNGETTGRIGSQSAVTAGDSISVGVTTGYDVRVVWEAEDGDDSATLAEDTGPDS